MSQTVSAPFGIRIPSLDLDLIDQAVAENPKLCRSLIIRNAVTEFVRSGAFLRLKEGN